MSADVRSARYEALESASFAARENPSAVARVANLASFLLRLLVTERDLLSEIVKT